MASGSLFGAPDAKYVLGDVDCPRIYVVNTRGEVWAHDLIGFTVGPGNKLNGHLLFGAPNDKYVVWGFGQILVINSQGEVWAHDVSGSTPNNPCGPFLIVTEPAKP